MAPEQANRLRLSQLRFAQARQGAPIDTFAPPRERGRELFTNPQSPFQTLTHASPRISPQYHQLRAGGDSAAIAGLCEWPVEQDDKAQAVGGAPVRIVKG